MIKAKFIYSKMFEHLDKSEQTRRARIKENCGLIMISFFLVTNRKPRPRWKVYVIGFIGRGWNFV